jgi:isoleucyl-tRNA synthetase
LLLDAHIKESGNKYILESECLERIRLAEMALADEMKRLRDQVKELEDASKQMIAEIAKLKEENENLRKQIETMRAEQRKKEAEGQGALAKLKAAEAEIEKLKEENKALQQLNSELKEQVEKLTQTQVLYYPLDSWFIRVTEKKEQLIKLNNTIQWKPKSTGTGRFGKWLENANDWNLSRSRYWGIPIPISRYFKLTDIVRLDNHQLCFMVMFLIQFTIKPSSSVDAV